tara:strand:+ start:45 stop:356 length:312 start_codon:yes stop_codon:yes gene_type:complete
MVGIATPFLEPTSRAICYRYFQTVGKPVLECETSRIINAITYHNGSNILPGINDTVFTTATGNNYLANGNYAISYNSRVGTPTSIITISGGSGVISAAQLCIF